MKNSIFYMIFFIFLERLGTEKKIKNSFFQCSEEGAEEILAIGAFRPSRRGVPFLWETLEKKD